MLPQNTGRSERNILFDTINKNRFSIKVLSVSFLVSPDPLFMLFSVMLFTDFVI